MRPECIVTDLDRTLTTPELALDPLAIGRVSALRRAGILVVLATGRRLDEVDTMGLSTTFDAVVAENGAVMSIPREGAPQVVGDGFAMRARAALTDMAASFAWGRAMGSGPRGLAAPASARLEAAGVSHEMEFNAEHAMLLPAGVSKASGAERCVTRLGSSAARTWAIGDGENDAALLRWAKVGAALGNAAPEAAAAADVRLQASYAQGFLAFTDLLVPSRGHDDARTTPGTYAQGW